MKIIQIRWVIAHEPLSLFTRAAETFARQINSKATTSKIAVEIMTLTEYSAKYNDGIPVTKHDLLDLMNSGKIEMSQMYTTWLAEKYNSDMHVLDMPFLFRNHEHAAKVLEGEIGEELLSGLNKSSKVRGLAYTYCGGFRMIPANQPIRKLEDFKGLTLRSNKNQFAMETFKAIGAIPVARELEEINDGILEGAFVGGESAWPRVYPLNQNRFSKAMNDTRHSLFLTSMIIQSDFWNTLDLDIQDLIREAAVCAAREERAESIRDGVAAQKRASAEGIEIVQLSKEDMHLFESKTQAVYKKFENFFSPGLVQKIKSH